MSYIDRIDPEVAHAIHFNHPSDISLLEKILPKRVR